MHNYKSRIECNLFLVAKPTTGRY